MQFINIDELGKNLIEIVFIMNIYFEKLDFLFLILIMIV